MKFRITIRGEHAELRGFVDLDGLDQLSTFAAVMKPYGIVMASPGDDIARTEGFDW